MQKTLEEAFHVNSDTVFDGEFWNRFVLELAARFRGLEGIKISWEEVSRIGIDVALDRINAAIGPAADRIQRITELGFLVAPSTTPVTLTIGQPAAFTITAGDARDLFSPSPFVLLGRSTTADDFAVARRVGYDRETGLLEVLVVSVVGDPGPHEDWSIGALAGSTLAQLLMLEDAEAARAAAMAAQQDIAPRHADVVTKHGQVLASAEVVATKRDQAVAAAAAAAQSALSIDTVAIASSILLAEQRRNFFG